MTQKQTFGQFLSNRRVMAGLTQKQLADKLFVDESTISKWEKGSRRPDIEFISELSKIFGITESELINASVDKARIKEKKQAKRYRAIVSTYHLTLIILFGIALGVSFIVNLAIDRTLSWFLIVLVALPLAYSIMYVPLAISKYGTAFMKRNNAVISILICAVILQLALIVIGTQTFGVVQSFTIALPILLFCLVPIIGTLYFVRYIKLNWEFKASILIFAWLIIIQIFNMLLSLLDIELSSGMIWQANLSRWNTPELVDANISLIISIISLIIIGVLTTLGTLKVYRKKSDMEKDIEN